MAHRDNSGTGGGLNDNASGTAALIELARSYAPTAAAQRITLPYSLVFLSTDGAEDGAQRRRAFRGRAARTRRNILGVINLDSIGGRGRPRLVLGRRHAALAGAGPPRDGARRARSGGERRAVAAERPPAARQPRASRSTRTSRRRS